jgi:acetyl-CoA carboxylase biotin carboxylase subunit
MDSAFRNASGEATSSFGDGRLYLERYLDRPRHVEIQVLFDHHGAGVHFGERECSVQRRHQKLVEECPCVVLDPATRARMGEVALRAARAVGYRNAGTVEFLLSGGEFYFLEMNTRLQVEHPVTEMVAGVDLVREQIRIAAGERLGYGQSDVHMRGHAIEVRLNAEDPSRGFVPSTGVIRRLRLPGGPGIRLDSALDPGLEVGLDYDPLLAKLVAWGETRDAAIARMIRALQELDVGGVRTSAPAALAVLEDARFRRGEFDTGLLQSIDVTAPRGDEDATAAAAAVIWRHRLARRQSLSASTGDRTGWRARTRAATGARPERSDGSRGPGAAHP